VLQIRTVGTRRDFRQFINLPYEIYAADPHWAPPLRLSESERLTPSKNPFFAHAAVELFLAVRDGKVVGRIAGIDDRLHNETHHDNMAAFGFFEADSTETAAALLRRVEDWARQRRRALVRGPLNPSLNESAGLLIEGFDSDPMLLMPHNPPVYGEYMESAGYRKVKDLFAWICELERGVPPVIVKLAKRLREKSGIAVRRLNLKEFTQEVERIRVIYCDAWERNWGFVAPTKDEFRRLASELKPIFDTRCAVCAEVDGQAVACAVAIPDINQALKGTNGRLFPLGLVRLLRRKHYITQVRLLLLGVEAKYRALGIYPVLIDQLIGQLEGGPYRRIEFSWVLEDNRDINGPAELAGARRYKVYRIYQKPLS
jgi:hypothetical protein